MSPVFTFAKFYIRFRMWMSHSPKKEGESHRDIRTNNAQRPIYQPENY